MPIRRKILLPIPERILEYVNEFASRQFKTGNEVSLNLPSLKSIAKGVIEQNKVFLVLEGEVGTDDD